MKQNKNEKLAYTPEFVESLKEGQVFVFGSNLIGYHSGGASLVAMQRFNAVWDRLKGRKDSAMPSLWISEGKL